MTLIFLLCPRSGKSSLSPPVEVVASTTTVPDGIVVYVRVVVVSELSGVPVKAINPLPLNLTTGDFDLILAVNEALQYPTLPARGAVVEGPLSPNVSVTVEPSSGSTVVSVIPPSDAPFPIPVTMPSAEFAVPNELPK